MPTRREFVAGAAAGTTLAGLSRPASARSAVQGANDRLVVAVMGVRSRGRALAYAFHNAGARVATIIDVDQAVLDDVRADLDGKGVGRPTTVKDVRAVLDDSAIDALVIATPDHWHAPAAIMALEAGKAVYVEKPCGHDPAEGEMLVAAQRKYGGVVQMGNQQRSSPETIELIERVRAGQLGDLYRADTWYANRRGSIGVGKDVPPPDRLDWELWQGPAPRRPYQDNVVHYNWHWFWRWGTGETCNNAAHELDVARWAMDVRHPEAVRVDASRRFYQDDDWEMYDTMQARFDYPGGRHIQWDGDSCNMVRRFGRDRGVLLYGTGGSAIVDRSGYELFDTDGKKVAERKAEAVSRSSTDLVGGDALTDRHVLNFVETVQGKAARQNSPIDEGATSTLMCHLANIAYRTDRPLEVDPNTGRAEGREAKALWSREYEDGWAPRV